MKSAPIILLMISSFFSWAQEKETWIDRVNNSPNGRIYVSLVSGDSALRLGDLATAEKKYLEGHKYLEQALKEDRATRLFILSETIFDPLDRLGQLYLLSNNLTKAEYYFELSNSLRKIHLKKHSIFLALPSIGLAEVEFRKKQYNRSIEYLKEAQKLVNNSYTGLIEIGNFMKPIYSLRFEIALLQSDYKTAGKYLGKLSAGGQSIDQNKNINIPLVFDMRTRYFMHVEDFQEANENLQKASDFIKVIQSKQLEFQIERTRALLLWSQNDIIGASKSFSKLISGYKDYVNRNFAAMSEYEREGFFEKLRFDFDLFNAFAIQNRDSPIAEALFAEAYNNQLFSKAILLNQINKQKNLILNSGDSELIELLKRWEHEKAFLSSLYFQKKVSSSDIESVERKIYTLEKEISERSSYLSDAQDLVIWQDVRNSLLPGEYAVEVIRAYNYLLNEKADRRYQFGDSVNYLALIITASSESPEYFIIDGGKDKDGSSLNFYRNKIKFHLDDNMSYDVYWRPFSSKFKGDGNIYLSADGAYNQININSLKNPETGRFVLDELNLVFVTNTKDLTQKKPISGGRTAALFGRPKYVSEQSIVTGLNVDSFGRDRSLDTETFETFREQLFVDLPGTETEVRSIHSIMSQHGWDVDMNTGVSASESELKSSFNPRVLHVATHGFFLPQNNWDGINSMMRSGIILAGVDKEKTLANDDGVLTAYEATNLKLDSTYLVVLSACETGLGVIKNGEGVYGLQRGFSVAGARFVLMSLWKVDDQVTQELMSQFYEEWLSGKSIQKSFETAQMSVRKSHPHPFYWGAFVLLGN